jgi:hypothetical protein
MIVGLNCCGNSYPLMTLNCVTLTKCSLNCKEKVTNSSWNRSWMLSEDDLIRINQFNWLSEQWRWQILQPVMAELLPRRPGTWICNHVHLVNGIGLANVQVSQINTSGGRPFRLSLPTYTPFHFMPPLVNGFQLPTYTGYGFTVRILDDFWNSGKMTRILRHLWANLTSRYPLFNTGWSPPPVRCGPFDDANSYGS